MKKAIFRKVAFMIIVLFCVSISDAQNTQWSNTRKLKGPNVFVKILGESSEGIFLVRYRNRFYTKNIIIEKYDNNLGFEIAQNVELKNSRLIKLSLTPQGILLVKSRFVKKIQAELLETVFLDFNLKQKGSFKVLDTLFKKTPINEMGFKVTLSLNRKKIGVISSFKNRLAGKTQLSLKIFEVGGGLLSSKVVNLPYKYGAVFFEQLKITNDGNLYFLQKEPLTKRINGDKIKCFKYLLYEYLQKNNELKDYLISDSLYIQSPLLSVGKASQELNLTAFYAENYAHKFNAIMHYSIKKGKGKLVLTPVPQDLFTEVFNSQKYPAEYLSNYNLIKVINRDDGGQVIFAESTSVFRENDVIMINGVPQSTSKNIYNFDDILVISYDNEGFVEWFKVVSKNQSSINDGGYFSSAVICNSATHIYIFFNDQQRENGQVLKYTISTGGTMKFSSLVNLENEYVVIIPNESKQVSSNKIIIPSSKNRRFALLKVIL